VRNVVICLLEAKCVVGNVIQPECDKNGSSNVKIELQHLLS